MNILFERQNYIECESIYLEIPVGIICGVFCKTAGCDVSSCLRFLF